MDDLVIRQDDVSSGQREPAPSASSPGDVATRIRRLRDARGMSKADLAKRAGLDPSTITRFEQGSRTPDREYILKLAEAMTLPVDERDSLLAAAGLRSVIWDDPDLIALAHVLADPALPVADRDAIRHVVRFAIAHATLARRQGP